MASWTTPRTWVDGEVTPASTYNAHWRDNLIVLKTSIGDDGRFLGLNASTLADLDGTNLTGLVGLTGAVWQAAANFNGGSGTRFKIPVGADKYAGTAGAKTPGSLWTEDSHLHFVDQSGNEWRYEGTFVASVGDPGSLWINSSSVYYVDENGDERYINGTTSTASGAHVDVAALAGSLWAEDFLHWVISAGSQEVVGHQDAHTDSLHSDSHGDTSHADAHSDTHGDVSHADTHSDTHGDVSHTDAHGDVAYIDAYTDHYDYAHVDTHYDTAHSDSHGDTSHTDTHSDTHGDTSHADTHSDTHSDVSHADSHGDAGYQDSYIDTPEAVAA